MWSTNKWYFCLYPCILIIYDGMGIWDRIDIYFCPIKKIRNRSETFFYPTCIHRTRVRLANSVPSISLLTKNENIFNWDWSRRILSFLGWDQNMFLSQKKYRDRSETFFHPTYIYGTGLRLVNHIPSRPIANPSSWIGEN